MDEVEKLIEQLKCEDDETRRNAAKRLANIKDKRAVPALCGALQKGDDKVRYWAAATLGQIGDASAVPALIGMLGDRNGNARFYASWALRLIINRCETVEDFEKVEEGIVKGSAALRKGSVDKCILIGVQIEIATLTRKIAGKKDELAPKRDLLLTDKPKSPKKGKGIYRTLKATVRV